MSNEERNKNLPPEPSPEDGSGLPGDNSWPLEDARGSSELPEERLGEQLGDTADSVTRELRDLQDELIPRTPAERTPVEPPLTPTEPATNVAAGQAPVEPLQEPLGASYARIGAGAETPSTAPWPAATTGGATAGSWTSNATVDPSASDDDRLLSMLAWLSLVILQLPVVSIIQLLSSETQRRSFQRHHAITSLLFFAAGIVYEIAATVVFTILTTVTLGCAGLCLWVIFFVPHALALYYAFQAYGGKRIELPYLSAYGRRQGWL